MVLPNPLSFPIQIQKITSSGPDSSGLYHFEYAWVRTNPPGNTSASGTVIVNTTNSDDYPVGQNLTFSLTLLP